MPIFAAFVLALFTSLVAFLVEFVTKKILVIAAIIAAMVLAAAAFAAVISYSLSQLSFDAPVFLSVGLSLLPSNTDVCISIIVTVKIAAWAHSWYLKTLSVKGI